jgi:hypothetical protein
MCAPTARVLYRLPVPGELRGIGMEGFGGFVFAMLVVFGFLMITPHCVDIGCRTGFGQDARICKAIK